MRGLTAEESDDVLRDAAALIAAQGRRDDEAARVILDHGDPLAIAMTLAGAVCALVRADGADPEDWAAQVLATLADVRRNGVPE